MYRSENILRPTKLDSFFGQDEIVKRLKVYIYSARVRDSILDHILFYGPPGLGKTTLAQIIANEMETNLVSISAPSLNKPLELISILSQLNDGDILFIDEIHRLKKEIGEILYSAMEDFVVYVPYKSEENTKAITLNVSPFTLIGATTNGGNLSNALRDRFPVTFKFNYYSLNDLILIINECSKILDLNFEEKCFYEIAKRSRLTPRVSNNLIKRIYDYMIYKGLKDIKYQDLIECFNFLKINEFGLNEDDISIIKLMYEKFLNVSVSLEWIASYLNEDVNNIKNINEPFLVNSGIIERTKRGRILTKKGIEIYKKIKN